MESQFSTQSSSPIGDIPYDVLREVFTYCVPQHPRDRFIDQPSFNNAPVILSHVCSSWMLVAHTSPILWCYLSCQIVLIDDDIDNKQWRLRKRDVELIRWWREKHGKFHPFIVMDAVFRHTADEDQIADEDASTFFLGYLASAQYLDIGSTFWDELNDLHFVCPNLHTLVLNGKEEYDLDPPFSSSQSIFSLAAASPLRRLSLNNGTLYYHGDAVSQKAWSSLTHIAMQDVMISLNFWFDLIWAAPTLEWAYADINDMEFDCEVSVKCVLPHLTSLFIICHDDNMSAAFSGLSLPALHTLSLSSTGQHVNAIWMTEHAIEELHQILKAAPNITTLALGRNFLGLGDPIFTSTPVANLPLEGTEPLWKNTPHLASLHLEKPFHYSATAQDAEKYFQEFTEHIFIPNAGWLSPGNSECPISTITLVNSDIKKVGNNTLSRCRELGERRGNIRIQFSGTSLDEQAWKSVKEWGLMI
ncbi:hypothetical protein BDN70DRAFT_886183 [Pholiota conissans]|uniref:F-box domain-containing protein n=1 Tax=Pholiota conissans TaxID=109636 RepID=A0A9P5YPN6_9AGAR|nr:hypothetical protein BDN70DRAFT_886183 [Pholiota conissans]